MYLKWVGERGVCLHGKRTCTHSKGIRIKRNPPSCRSRIITPYDTKTDTLNGMLMTSILLLTVLLMSEASAVVGVLWSHVFGILPMSWRCTPSKALLGVLIFAHTSVQPASVPSLSLYALCYTPDCLAYQTLLSIYRPRAATHDCLHYTCIQLFDQRRSNRSRQEVGQVDAEKKPCLCYSFKIFIV